MSKLEVLKTINSDVDYIIEANKMLYRGKVYVLGDNIRSFYKTKRGAEGENKRLSNISYYDEYAMEMTNCGGYEVFEILENELLNINDIKTWYQDFRKNQGRIQAYNMDKQYLYNAENNVTNEETLKYIKETLKGIMEEHSMTIIEAYEHEEETQDQNTKGSAEQKQESIAEHDQENHTQESPVEQKANNITVTLNEEKNGIEIKFEEKPSEGILSSLHDFGFRWSKYQKLWYAKQSEEKISFANNLVNSEQPTEQDQNNISTSEQVTQHTYPTIDINDIDTYTVDKKLSDRENSISMFRSKDRNHQKEIQEFLQSANDEVIELINLGCNAEIEYRAKRTLQSFKKKYYDLFIKMLTHRANNPSWAVTGRGNLNVNRYNKKQEQYNKMLGEITSLTDEFNNKMKSYERQVKETSRLCKEKEVKEYIDKTDTVVQVEKTKVNINVGATTNIFNDATFETTAYHFDNKYFIIKHWGYWRIYDKTGNELRLKKAAIKTLTEAKDQLKYIIANELNSAAV